ncbi:MAG TPA: dihydroorotase family protein [Candidatus Bathyarchaeia archaeon]|nr:dihydroorotase family protein [Candidatus Bathyarchaeia archaeon]
MKSTLSTLIESAQILIGEQLDTVHILLENGKIRKISKARTIQADNKINAKGLIVVPGLIDAHVHLRDMELSYKETFETGTQAAAAGGFTTVIDMPNTKPPTISSVRLDEKKAKAEGRLFANIAFQGALIQDPRELQLMKEHGAIAFKLYLNKALETFDTADDAQLRNAFLSAKKANVLVTVHAEDGDAIRNHQQASIRAGKTSINAFLRAHPPKYEVKEVRRILKLSKELAVRVHICHTSVPEAVQFIRHVRGATCEATPHHLFLNHSIFKKQGTLALCVPPIRSEQDRSGLWRCFKKGQIDILASDHAPHTIEEKALEVWKAASGVPGLETSLPLLLTQFSRGTLSLRRLIDATSTLPAKIFRLANKGRLEEGFDADIVIIDPKAETRINSANFLSKAKYSPFDGMKCKGAVAYTILNGEVVAQNGNIVGSSNGRIVMS